jgi:hypothetical protein
MELNASLYGGHSGAWSNIAEIEVPRQCGEPNAASGHTLLAHDSDSGLFRHLTDEEFRLLWADTANTPCDSWGT